MKTILSLTDFSPVADTAVEVGFMIAEQQGATLLIMHAMPLDNSIQLNLSDTVESDDSPSKDREGIYEMLQEWKSRATKSGLNLRIILSNGDLVKSITNSTEAADAELVIMGTTGLGQSDGIWGTTTKQVVKQLPLPVLVVKDKPSNALFDNIVFASDLDPEDQIALTTSIELLKPASTAKIHLVSVNTSSFSTQPRALMTALLDDFSKLVMPYESNTTFYSDYSVAAGIRHFVEHTKPDLLIMSSRKRNPIKDLFIPDPAMAAVGELPCPVLIIK